METILYGNNISLKWSFVDVTNGENFSFENTTTRLIIKSYYYSVDVTHTVEGNVVYAEINTNNIPHGNYSLELQYQNDTVGYSSKVIVNNAFKVTGTQQSSSSTVSLEITSMAMPFESDDITAIEYLEFDDYLQMKNQEILSKRSLYVIPNDSDTANVYLYKYKYPQSISSYLPGVASSFIVADEEDLTITYKGNQRVFQFKDRSSENGLGYVILRKEKNAIEQITQSDTIYEIRYDFDLNGQTLNIPNNCTLKFNGGIITNGTIKGSNTAINSDLQKIFGTDISFEGTYDIECWYPEWFGAVSGSSTTMSTKAIQAALNAARRNIKIVKLTGASYYIDDTLLVYSSQSLIGTSPSVHHYSGINIYQTKNKHAIQLTSTDANIWRICLKDFTITNNYYGSDMNNCGIYVYNGDVQTYFYHNEIINVCCTQFDKGFMYDGYGDGAFAYNYFHEFATYYNKIGFYIKGNLSSDTTVTQYPWCNLNRWSFCKFMNNSIGGIYIHQTRSQQENVFESCGIEGNGKDYKLNDYTQYGGAGWGFRGNNKFCFGYTRFYNCYVENNFPRRTLNQQKDNFDSTAEYIRGSYAYPNDIETNEYNAAFVCYRQSISVEKCMLSRYIKLYSGKREFSLRFEGNDYDFGKLTYMTDPTIDYLFYLNWAPEVVNYCNIYIDESYPKGDRDSSSPTLLTRIKSVFKLGETCFTQANRNIKMYINVPSLEKPIHYNGRNENDVAKIYSGCIYVGGENCSNDTFVTSRLQSLKGLAYAEQLSKYYDGVDEVTIRLIGNYTSNDDNYTGVFTNNIRIIGDKNVEYNITKTKQLPTKTKIENIIFNAQHSSWSYMFETNAETIEFTNCTFNLRNVEQYIARIKRGGHIFFNNCKFNVEDTSKGTIICVQNNSHYTSRIHTINCTVQEDCELQIKPYTWYHGNEIYKREGDVVMPDNNNNTCVYDGEDVVNWDGTLYNKVRRIKNDATMIKSVGAGTNLNTIVTDLDLNGQTISLPWDSVLDFKGGKFKNGTIALNRARLLPMGMPLSYYIDSTCTINGNYWATGQTIYDTDLGKMKLWNGTTWVNLDGSSL